MSYQRYTVFEAHHAKNWSYDLCHCRPSLAKLSFGMTQTIKYNL